MAEETIDQKIKKFHSHLDVCTQCENHPFDLCPIGAKLLKDAATHSPQIFLIQHPNQSLDSFLKVVGKRYPEFLDIIKREHWVRTIPTKKDM